MRYKLLLFVFVISANQLIIAQSRPNIIFILADDLGYADLSCYGRKNYQTPHLDKLASEGIKFHNAYAGSALCTPSRVSLMTGRYPARTPVGLWEPLTGSGRDSLVGLSPEYRPLPGLLQKNGYSTILIGKWHLGFLPEFSPLVNGFDEFFGFLGGATDYISHTNPGNQPDLYENNLPIVKEGYSTDLFKEKAIQVIQREHTKPFFLCLMFNAPHWPWQAPGDSIYPLSVENWRKGGSPETFARMIKNMDDAIGAVLAALDETSAANTIVIFTSDNGGENFSDMGPFAGRKALLREGGIRVPAIVRWPGRITANSITDQAIITMDWSATILSLSKTNYDPLFPIDGIDLTTVCTGESKPIKRTFYWRMTQRNPQKAIRDGNWKYLRDTAGEYLFDLAKDPGEKNDLKAKNRKIFAKLKRKFSQWEKTILPPVPLTP